MKETKEDKLKLTRWKMRMYWKIKKFEEETIKIMSKAWAKYARNISEL